MTTRVALLASALAVAGCSAETKYVYPGDLASSNYIRRTRAAQEFAQRADPSDAEAGFPLLMDERISLRALGHMTLRELSDGEDFGYRADLEEGDRARVARRWQHWWSGSSRAGTGTGAEGER